MACRRVQAKRSVQRKGCRQTSRFHSGGWLQHGPVSPVPARLRGSGRTSLESSLDLPRWPTLPNGLCTTLRPLAEVLPKTTRAFGTRLMLGSLIPHRRSPWRSRVVPDVIDPPSTDPPPKPSKGPPPPKLAIAPHQVLHSPRTQHQALLPLLPTNTTVYLSSCSLTVGHHCEASTYHGCMIFFYV